MSKAFHPPRKLRHLTPAAMESEQQLREIVQHDPNTSVAVFDRDMRYLFVSPRYIRDFGLTGKPVLGRSHYDVLPEIPERWREIHRRCLAGAVERSDEDWFTRADGTVDVTRWMIRPWRLANGEIGGIILYSELITARKQHEREMEVITRISVALRSAMTPQEMYHSVLEQVQQILPCDALAVVSLPRDGQADVDRWLLVEHGRGAWAEFTGKRLSGMEIGSLLAPGDSLTVVNQLSSQPALQRHFLLQGHQALLSALLMQEEECLGAIWVARARPFNPEEQRLLATVASITSGALKRAQLHEQTAQHIQRLTALRAIDQAITASMDLRVTLTVLINQITTQLNIDAANVLLYHPETHTLQYAAGRNLETPDFKNVRIRLGDSSAGQAALERKLIYVTNIETLDPVFRAKCEIKQFATYIAVPLVAKGRIKGVLELFHRSQLPPNPEWNNFLNAVGAQAAIAIDNAEMLEQLQRSNLHLTLAYDATISGWARALELRDREARGHAQRVTDLSLSIARKLRVEESAQVHIQRGALLHDVGMLAVPDSVLLKTEPLNEGDWEILRRHPQQAVEMLSPVDYLRPALEIPAYHHERWDGSGYPNGLAGDAIPLAARIFAVCDVWDAMRTDRLYRKAWPREEARRYLLDQSGRLFDPQVIAAFDQIISEPQRVTGPLVRPVALF